MTFSIVAVDKDSGACGVATITGGIAVGAFVPHAKAGVGAIATQGALTNWLYGEYGLQHLQNGQNAEDTLSKLTHDDNGKDYRQCIIADANGQISVWTGKLCRKIYESYVHQDVGAAGNWLHSEGTAKAMVDAYNSEHRSPMAERFIAALSAGFDAGGDSRGMISSALKIDYLDRPPVDIRIDNKPDQALEALIQTYKQYTSGEFKAFYDAIPTRSQFDKS